jgi:hypothetical protein
VLRAEYDVKHGDDDDVRDDEHVIIGRPAEVDEKYGQKAKELPPDNDTVKIYVALDPPDKNDEKDAEDYDGGAHGFKEVKAGRETQECVVVKGRNDEQDHEESHADTISWSPPAVFLLDESCAAIREIIARL